MRRPLLTLVLLAGILAGAEAQETAGAVPQQRKPAAGEFRLGFSSHALRRNSALEDGSLASGSGTLRGLELIARADGLGLMARRVTGSMAGSGHGLAGDFLIQEVRALLGARIFSVEGGLLQRTSSRLNTTTEATLWRVGARSQWTIGGSGVVISLAAGALFSRLEEPGSAAFQGAGHDLDAQVLMQAPGGLPLYVLVGWLHQRFDDLEHATPRWEEGSGPYFGLGLRFAPRPVIR